MPLIFQRIQIFVVLLLLVGCPIAARASEPITVIYGRGRESLMNLTINGQSQLEKGDLAAARQSLDAVIKADPTFYPAYYIRAEVFLNQRKYQEAIQDCNEALRKDSTFAEAALLRARASYYLSRFGESLKEIDHVINIRPRQDALARAYGERAWFQLNCPDQSYRNGQQALKDATAACKLIGWKDEDMIDTLAVAYAEVGDFDSAVRYEEKALALKGVKPSESKRLQAHLDSFKQHRPSTIVK
jgi:tetratricopeptide (TPR) repeat protein